MKNYLMGILLLLTTININAQRVVEKQIDANPDTRLNLKLEFADTIKIIQSSNNKVKIKATVNINDNLHNDKYELITNESGQSVSVSAKIHDMKSLRVPCKNRRGSNYNYSNGECLTMDINYTIEVPEIANLQIETINGDIIINNAKTSMSINSISGFIDINIPDKASSDLRIKTVTGGVYTNHEFSKTNDHCNSSPGGTDAHFQIGSGEKSIKLTTVSGDIFVRKI